MTLSFDKTFFTYDTNERVIRQIIGIQKPTIKTINAILKNESGINATYSIVVNFVCNITTNLTYNIKVE